MKTTVCEVLRDLDLDYQVTMISGGQGGKCEIVLSDPSRGSYFSIKCRWVDGDPPEPVAQEVKRQLVARLDQHLPERFSERRPVRPTSSRGEA